MAGHAAAMAWRRTLAAALVALCLSSLASHAAPTRPGGDDGLDCAFRYLAYEHALALQPWRPGKQRDTFDALLLSECGHATPPDAPHAVMPPPTTPVPTHGTVVYVDATKGSDANPGTITQPFQSIAHAVAHLQAATAPKTAVLRAGTFFLKSTLELTSKDSHLTIMNYPGERAVVSGGVSLAGVTFEKEAGNVYAANVGHLLSDVPGLFTLEPHRRWTRARFPNADVEVDQWGYNSPDKLLYSVDASKVAAWTKPKPGPPPKFDYIDLSQPNPTGVIKNNSAMTAYNSYGTGEGGVCSNVWAGPSYWCSNSSAGGWAFVDKDAATSGQLQLPVGMEYDGSDPRLRRFAGWANATGALVHAWHSQSWFVNMFEIGAHDAKASRLDFTRGGWQGGRNWCSCSQCSYAGPWCHPHNDSRLISGTWYVDGVREELDAPTEFFFDSATGKLYIYPNATAEGTSGDGARAAVNASNLVVPVLQTLVSLKGTQADPVTGVHLAGLSFRDAAYTYMEGDKWGVPSGGDWALYRGGAVLFEGVTQSSAANCLFRRLDGNALFLAGFNRDINITRNEFVWIGDGAKATWGDTDGIDARASNQPRHILVQDNYVHELGLYEKQSSFWGQAKSALVTLRNNIAFNMPRAAINYNDGLGGGNVVQGNLIFNTCRESGDHGPINSWDRLPFLTTLRGHPSYDPLPNIITQNLIYANYGGAQSVDNDDGSSFYHISDNVFYSADGFKMDYGGHNSKFDNNLVITLPYDGQNCLNVATFLTAELADVYTNNTCVVMSCRSPSCDDQVSHIAQCDLVTASGNHYYTLHGNATVQCGRDELSIPDAQKKFGIEMGSTFAGLPSTAQMLAWAQAKIQGWPQ